MAMNHKQIQLVILERLLGDIPRYAGEYAKQPGFSSAKVVTASGHLVGFLSKRIQKLESQIEKAQNKKNA